MKVANSFVLFCETEFGTRSGIAMEFRKDIGLYLSMACWALAGLPCNKQTDRQRLTAIRAEENSGHFSSILEE